MLSLVRYLGKVSLNKNDIDLGNYTQADDSTFKIFVYLPVIPHSSCLNLHPRYDDRISQPTIILHFWLCFGHGSIDNYFGS